ncbi:molybdenum cofactor biosynthesis protein MoaB [Candidatus Woesearchaeota archaeon]|nr:molybdenum cofactor biosynthesis protein MoaB [Candidatus Woesearchaeota archaeon]
METTIKHKKEATANKVRFGIITLSNTRNKKSDVSGELITKKIVGAGHVLVSHSVVKDEENALLEQVKKLLGLVDIIITSGGTGVSRDDITIETLKPLFDKELTGFQTVFTLLSYQEIRSAAILSRATAGVIGSTVVFCVPGSPAACSLALDKIILREAPHIIKHLKQ